MNSFAVDSMVFKNAKATLIWECEFSTTYHALNESLAPLIIICIRVNTIG